jgi:hypothetical protein
MEKIFNLCRIFLAQSIPILPYLDGPTYPLTLDGLHTLSYLFTISSSLHVKGQHNISGVRQIILVYCPFPLTID